ncbi:MAG: TIGR01212 family radical SAM protein [Bacteroidaceae bacterium]|nr:TIGR01212 family radical SAM protein [Bacteroidaceae bacterium]
MNAEHRPYYDFSTFLRQYFEGKVQKISVHAGFTCPNRDGAKGVGGCTYCNNQTFNPEYCDPKLSVTQQLEDGIRFFERKYPAMRYLAYFQAYTNTYGELEHLKKMYEEALAVDAVVGLVIGTRPDCMPDALLDYLQELNRRTFLMVEYGIESANDETLLRINRGHDFATAVEAVRRTHERGILTGGHLILGLPGEERDELLRQTSLIASLPLDMLKLHQLQLIKGTRMAREYEEHPEWFHLYEADEYIELAIDYIERIPQHVVIERFISQSPRTLLIAPDWGMKNHEFVDRLRRRMAERNTWQGKAIEQMNN